MFLGLLGSRHVQTSLENIIGCGFFAFFGFFVSFFSFLWVFDSLGLVKINPD